MLGRIVVETLQCAKTIYLKILSFSVKSNLESTSATDLQKVLDAVDDV